MTKDAAKRTTKTGNSQKSENQAAEWSEKESRFVWETLDGLVIDNSQAEGEPLDFGRDDADEDDAAKDAP